MAAKFAYTIWQWGGDKESVIAGCKEVSEVGYKYFESTKPFIDVFKNDKAELRSILDTYDLAPTGAYFHLNGTKENDLDDVEAKIPFMLEFGMKLMTVQAVGVFGRSANQEELDYALKTITQIGKICKPYGIKPCVHPHYNTTVMIPSDIDFIMQNTDPDEVWFCPDTAHITAGGGNAAEVVEKYKNRIGFTHLKDILTASKLESEGMEEGKEVYSNFRELGEGNVDYKSVFESLKSINYDGFLCAELDRSRFGNKISAEMSMKFLKENW
ncbi:MAG: hypothetical protein E7487_01505 [Ruminococcaceae bacterium]|nr:hypothetical protein [Oscillospiraceae bacterium]